MPAMDHPNSLVACWAQPFGLYALYCLFETACQLIHIHVAACRSRQDMSSVFHMLHGRCATLYIAVILHTQSNLLSMLLSSCLDYQ